MTSGNEIQKSGNEIQKLLSLDENDGSFRSRQRAKKLLPEFKKTLGLSTDADNEIDRRAEDFILNAILGAAWYKSNCGKAKKHATKFIWINSALVVAIPAALIGMSWIVPSGGASALIIGQFTGTLTGIFALQKTLSAWYSSQQRFAAWHKAGADLTSLFYSLVQEWDDGRAKNERLGFIDSLEAATANARRVLDEEELDYYQKLALPSFDVLDMLTASRSSVASLVSSLVPTAPEVQAVAVGTKTTLGAAAGPEEDTGARSEATSSIAGTTRHPGLASVTAIRSTQSISPRALDQAAVDACTSIAFAGSAEISDFFAGQGGFFAWYNETLARHPAFAHRSRIRSTPLMRERFDDFWDQIPAISGKQEISGLQFCALASVAIQETSGDFWANPERVGNAEHPGLAYAFDRIPGLKASYNTLAGNRTALDLFNDDIFRNAHGHRPGAIQPGKVDQEWEGDTWPVGVSVKVDPEVNGFIMQADFYKFRGRGVIQTTGRSNYKALINFLLSDEAAPHLNPGLSELVARWRDAADAQGPDKLLEQVATLSSNEDWDLAFAEPMVLAAGIRLHSKANRDYLDLSADARVLNQEARVPGSLYNMARSINAGGYASRVVPMMRMMIRTFADIAGPAAMVAGTANGTTNGAKVLRV